MPGNESLRVLGYNLYRPTDPAPGARVPLVVFLHGYGQSHDVVYFPSDPVADVEDKLNIRYEYIDPNAVPKRKVFTPRTRRIVRIWSRYGLIGLAAITPILLSIPIGTFFITRLERNKKKILLYMFISIASWSLLLTTVFEFTNTQHLQDFLR